MPAGSGSSSTCSGRLPTRNCFHSDLKIQYWNASDHALYVFMDTPADLSRPEKFYTNRSINATWSCSSFRLRETKDGDFIPVNRRNSGIMQPFPTHLFLATTYATRTNETCGKRCARVWA